MVWTVWEDRGNDVCVPSRWVPGVAGVGPPSPPPFTPHSGVVTLTGRGLNRFTKRALSSRPLGLKVSDDCTFEPLIAFSIS